MKLGLFGGTFDPVHLGHLLLAECCREQLDLDEVRFLPAASNPLKAGGPVAGGKDRCDLVQFAISGHPRFTLDRREVKRGGESYAVETLAEVAAENPGADLFFLMGADALTQFWDWKDPDRILELAVIAAVNRGDSPAVKPPDFPADRLRFVTMPACGLSATELRRRAAAGESLRYRTTPAVAACVADRGLYGGKAEGGRRKAEGAD